MSGSKHFDRIAWTVTALMLILTVLFMSGSVLGLEVMPHTMGYEKRLFDNTRVHTINIVMDNWTDFISDAASEQYYAANVVIDGEVYKNVGIRGKGNTSLSTVSSLGSSRYSFKIEFDQYDSSLSYYGLDKLSLNNLIQDATMMKDYLTYTMMNEFGVAAPLCSFVYITVNGEDWGLYLAVEGVENAFLERNYGSDYGELYKPDSMSFGGGRGNGKNFDMDDFISDASMSDNSTQATAGTSLAPMPGTAPGSIGNGNRPSSGDGKDDFRLSTDKATLRAAFEKLGLDLSLLENIYSENISLNDIQSLLASLDKDTLQKLMQEIMGNDPSGFGGTGSFGMGSSDVKLQYIDDDIDSYSNIWNNAKTDITTSDQMRLIASLKKLSEGEDIASVVDIEQVLRYFVVHNFVCNGDSYTGSMIHNYYLYEDDGQLAMLPWDYNLAYGTFSGGDATGTVNTPIDLPVSGGSSDRPMLNWIFESAAYTEQYHQYFAEFLTSVDISGIIEQAYNLIRPYVEKDPTAFYTPEEFKTGVETLRQFCTLRAESITMQLKNGETSSNTIYADASGLTLSDMGSMNAGGGFGDRLPDLGGHRGGSGRTDDTKVPEIPGNSSSLDRLGENISVTFGGVPQNPFGATGELPDGFDASQMEEFDPTQIPGDSNGSFPAPPSGETETSPSENTDEAAGGRPNMQWPGGNFNSGTGNTGNFSSDGPKWAWIIVSVLILGAGLLIAKRYKY